MNRLNVTIDDINVQVDEGSTILDVATVANIDVPTLCFLKDINEVGVCRMCIAEVEGVRGFVASCVFPVANGMIIKTNTPAIRDARSTTLELILSNHNRECLICERNRKCELQKLCETLNIENISYVGEKSKFEIDESSEALVRDNNKCILCKRCISQCSKQNCNAIDQMERGFKTYVGAEQNHNIKNSSCISCGQCIMACPTGALIEKSSIHKVWKALKNPDLHVVVQSAPSVRVALGDEFGMPIGTNVEGKMITALKKLGFAKIFDTNTGADFTIMEEATELISRLKNGKNLPMTTSCSPGWINFAEMHYSDLLEHVSTVKSPQQILGALLKTYYAEKMGIEREKIFVVSVMPCIAKKTECKRNNLKVDNLPDVDETITTRELARMIKEANINFTELEDSTFDEPLGEASGAGAIFGTTGGVMEAAIRTASELLVGKPVKTIEVQLVRGFEGLKEAKIEVGEHSFKVAVAHGLNNATMIMDQIRAGTCEYDFIEIMACPGGCITGGGQPRHSAKVRAEVDIHKLRREALYEKDKGMRFRKSHDNPILKKIYKDFIGESGGELAHKLFHQKFKEQ